MGAEEDAREGGGAAGVTLTAGRGEAARADSRGPAEPGIGDYAIIGDCRSAALISTRGAIDWLCWPRFDSPSLFAALLDRERGGQFAVSPAAAFRSSRRYLDGTNVLETVFETGTGRARLTDFMPVASERIKASELWPEHQILRRIEGLDGQVALHIEYAPRPGYARVTPRLVDRGRMGIECVAGADAFTVQSDIPLSVVDSGAARGHITLHAGDTRWLSLSFAHGNPAVLPPLSLAGRRLNQTCDWWREWLAGMRYEGAHERLVTRSALVLKLLTYAPSGAFVAAPTTSLPERIGGPLNWDYRYCWLRDASLTLRAFLTLGLDEEANAFLAWMLHATRLTWPRVQVMYDVYGRTRLAERTLDHLAGYRGSRPVRIGNGAHDQLQLDVYGHVVDAVYRFVRHGGSIDRTEAQLLRGLGETVCALWREPDEGIWEPRAARTHHTVSKALCAVALDRLLELDGIGLFRVPARRFRDERDAILDAVERHGWNEAMGSYVSQFDGDTVDASLLILSDYGFIDAASERMRSTIACIEERLGVNGLLYRYLGPDGGPPGEGAFGICSFWHVRARAQAGDFDRAAATFEHVAGFANDVGLFGEEIDPTTGTALGNFPQAFTHIGLITAAVTLMQREPRHEPCSFQAERTSAS